VLLLFGNQKGKGKRWKDGSSKLLRQKAGEEKGSVCTCVCVSVHTAL
jgi:hypothetical protein